MDIEEIINNLNLSKQRLSPTDTSILLYNSEEESVRILLNEYNENPDEIIWLLGW